MDHAARAAHIEAAMNGPKKPLKDWMQEKVVELTENQLQMIDAIERAYGVPDLTEWQASMILHNYFAIPYSDPTDTEVEVTLTVRAKVKVVAPVRAGVMEQYGWSTADAWDDEKLGKAMLFAALNPAMPGVSDLHWQWDGVGMLHGRISQLTLEDNE